MTKETGVIHGGRSEAQRTGEPTHGAGFRIVKGISEPSRNRSRKSLTGKRRTERASPSRTTKSLTAAKEIW